MPDSSARLSLPLIQPSQAQKHVTHNEALARLDMLVQLVVSGFEAEEPPAAPVEGEIHALGAAPTGAWAGQGGMLACRRDGAWHFIAPQPGWLAAEADGGGLRIRSGTGFVPVPAPVQAGMLGLNASADSGTRLAVASPASRFSHDGDDHRLVVNRAGAGDTASVVFQSGWSGRAEIGLAGGEDLSLKVSPDGSAWTEGLRVEAATGALLPGAGLRFPATPAPVADPTTLDAYAEGDWTPVLTAATAASGVAGTATGSYVKVGRLVLASFGIALSATGSGGAGPVRITGFPFAAASGQAAALLQTGIAFPGDGAPAGLLSGTEMALQASDGTALDWADLPAGSCSLQGSISYIAGS